MFLSLINCGLELCGSLDLPKSQVRIISTGKMNNLRGVSVSTSIVKRSKETQSPIGIKNKYVTDLENTSDF